MITRSASLARWASFGETLVRSITCKELKGRRTSNIYSGVLFIKKKIKIISIVVSIIH
jgi:hypothetical protein